MSFNIAIIGAGVAGLSAAIALARDGHIVHVYERRRDTNEDSGSGVQIQPTGVQILRQWGLIEGLSKIAHENGEVKLFRYDTAELIGVQTRRGARGCVEPSSISLIVRKLTFYLSQTVVLHEKRVSKVSLRKCNRVRGQNTLRETGGFCGPRDPSCYLR